MKKSELIKKAKELLHSSFHIPNIPNLTKDDLEKLNVRYPLVPPFAYGWIYWDPIQEELVYYVLEPDLEKDEMLILSKLEDRIPELITVDLNELSKRESEEYLFDLALKIFSTYRIKLPVESILKIFYYLWRDLIGLERIEPLMHDIFIEDISCDGLNTPIFVNHRKYGILKTNIIFTSKDSLEKFVIKLAQKCGRYVSYAEPLLDATLPDGSRVNATYSSDVTTRGPTFTIRKFRKDILTIVDLILSNTLDIYTAAYLWWAVENRANILIAGETASGKTTLLNAISMFIPPNAKIISIEDTREIQLYHENWIPSVTREGFGYVDETGRRFGTITMFDLLRESFRQNPDYIIVGEIRGEEAYTLFQGMASGHACLSTMHADSMHAILRRLTTPPINLPLDLVELLDLAIFLIHAKDISPSARRVKMIIEVGEVENENIIQNKHIIWNPSEDNFVKINESILENKIGKKKKIIGSFKESINEKIEILEYLVKKRIKDLDDLARYMRMYYTDKKALLRTIQDDKNF